MTAFEKSKWIWISDNNSPDEYGEFFAEFEFDEKSADKPICRISCDGDYTLFINGKYAASNQYGDYEHYKIYDELDITPFLKTGANIFKALVWHFGSDTSRYINNTPGIIFEITRNDTVILSSGEETLCRKSKAYKSGYKKTITPQLGYSFLYNANSENDTAANAELSKSRPVKKETVFYKRPCKKLNISDRKKVLLTDNGKGTYFLADLGEETVGLPAMEFYSDSIQKIRVDYGEDLQNGHVRRTIGGRDFSFEYIAKPGKNSYTNYMLRLGCRYMELYSEKPIKVDYIGLMPQYYPVKETNPEFSGTPTDKKIYRLCVNTLKLCMMEHYVDCPWREQCLYTFDARNQMLCGYYAFENGNRDYARSNLKLISEDRREDGLLSICYPCGTDLTIPSFSLYYFIAVNEYSEHTGDLSLINEVYPKLTEISKAFIKNRKNGLICKFSGENRWNFYDWSEGLEGTLSKSEEAKPDLIINCLFIIAIKNLEKICDKINGIFPYRELLRETEKRTKENFLCKENGLFGMNEDKKLYTVLGNSLAVIAEITTKKEACHICESIQSGHLTDCSLSMKAFKYDALLKTDESKYKNIVLNEIRKDYKAMLDAGATSAWETADGASAFGNAGSLCHGWSAIPVYYYHKLKNFLN